MNNTNEIETNQSKVDQLVTSTISHDQFAILYNNEEDCIIVL